MHFVLKTTFVCKCRLYFSMCQKKSIIILELFCDKFIIKIYVCYLLEQSRDIAIVK
jgi:hypothetical protein